MKWREGLAKLVKYSSFNVCVCVYAVRWSKCVIYLNIQDASLPPNYRPYVWASSQMSTLMGDGGGGKFIKGAYWIIVRVNHSRFSRSEDYGWLAHYKFMLMHSKWYLCCIVARSTCYGLEKCKCIWHKWLELKTQKLSWSKLDFETRVRVKVEYVSHTKKKKRINWLFYSEYYSNCRMRAS